MALIKTEHPPIVRVPGIAGGRPIIAGTRISVDFIAGQLRVGDRAEDILASYSHLTPAAVHAAISYYFDHKDEIDRFLAESTIEAVAERNGLEIRPAGRIVPKSG
jgi:uncharacterized protein (DUF433 family)